MQTNADCQVSTESIRRIWRNASGQIESLIGLKLRPNIVIGRTAHLLVLIGGLLFLRVDWVKAYEVRSVVGGIISIGHWDSLEKKYDPLTQQITGPWKFGNSQDTFNVSQYKVIPQAGDALSGPVLLKVGYRATETLRQDLLNFTPAPFDYHYTFNYRTAPDFNLRLPGPDYPLARTEGETGFFLLEATIGVPFALEFRFGGNIHEGWSAGDWSPEVMDPSIPGRAYMQISGAMKLVSMEVVPEPTTAVMTLLGASLLGMTFRRRAR